MSKRNDKNIENNTDSNHKKAKLSHENDKLNTFLQWCQTYNIAISKKALQPSRLFTQVCMAGFAHKFEAFKAYIGHYCAQFGMIASEKISSGECIFEIPRNILLSPETSHISNILQKDASLLKSKSGWVPLLVALMHEYTTADSKWRPYMDLVPNFDELDLPLFWDRDTRLKELKGTGVDESAVSDESSLTEEFNSIVLPFIEKHAQYFTAKCRELQFYKQMVAFVMSYSFTEPPPEREDQSDSEDESHDQDTGDKTLPMMVPVADILNHVANNNANLDFGNYSLKMVAVKDIEKGEEIFNTYGELSNAQLLHMYGFAEAYPLNVYDVVEFPMTNVFTYLEKNNVITNLLPKWNALKHRGIITKDGAFVLGAEGILTEDELSETLRVLFMSEHELKDYTEDEWTEADTSLLNDDIATLPETWRELLVCLTTERLKEFPRTLQEEEAVKCNSLSPRQRFAQHVRYGQQKLLTNFLSICRSLGMDN